MNNINQLLEKQLQDFREDFDCEFTEKDTKEEAVRNVRMINWSIKRISTCQRQIIEEVKEEIKRIIPMNCFIDCSKVDKLFSDLQSNLKIK